MATDTKQKRTYGKYTIKTTPPLINSAAYDWTQDAVYRRLSENYMPEDIRDIPRAQKYERKEAAAAAFHDSIEKMDKKVKIGETDEYGEYSNDDPKLVRLMWKKLAEFPGCVVELHHRSPELPAEEDNDDDLIESVSEAKPAKKTK